MYALNEVRPHTQCRYIRLEVQHEFRRGVPVATWEGRVHLGTHWGTGGHIRDHDLIEGGGKGAEGDGGRGRKGAEGDKKETRRRQGGNHRARGVNGLFMGCL